MTKNKKILFIGKRLDAIKVALEGGFDVYVLTADKSHPKKKVKSKKYFEVEYHGNFESLKNIEFDAVIPLTEKSVGIAHDFCQSRVGSPNCSKADLEKYVVCHNKFEMKKVALTKNIPITQFQMVENIEDVNKCVSIWGFPIVLKEVDSSGSRGQIFIKDKSHIPENISHRMIAEKWIEGREFSMESFVYKGNIIFTNITEYYEHHHCNIVPATWAQSVKNEMLRTNEMILKAYNIQNGMSHVECFQTAHGFVMGEIAVRPPGGYLMKLIEMAYGFSPWRVLIDIETGTQPFLYPEAKTHAATWIIHPGKGVVENEPDFLPIVNDSAIVDIKSGLKKGMKVPEREGSGQDFGRILLQSKDPKALYTLLEKIKPILKKSTATKV